MEKFDDFYIKLSDDDITKFFGIGTLSEKDYKILKNMICLHS
jgi:hypothetical protein